MSECKTFRLTPGMLFSLHPSTRVAIIKFGQSMPKHDGIGTIIRINPIRGSTDYPNRQVRERAFEPSDLNAWKAGYRECTAAAQTLLAILPESEQPKQCRHNSEPQAGVDVGTRGTQEAAE